MSSIQIFTSFRYFFFFLFRFHKEKPFLIIFLLVKHDRCNWPRGKVLGGSSVLNYMLYVRGNRRDYDSWAANGNTGWSYEDVLPYFLKSEDNRNPYLAKNKYHTTGGYLTVQEAPYKTPLAAAFIAAGEELGYKNRDCNGEFQTGFMFPQGKDLFRLSLVLSTLQQIFTCVTDNEVRCSRRNSA